MSAATVEASNAALAVFVQVQREMRVIRELEPDDDWNRVEVIAIASAQAHGRLVALAGANKDVEHSTEQAAALLAAVNAAAVAYRNHDATDGDLRLPQEEYLGALHALHDRVREYVQDEKRLFSMFEKEAADKAVQS